MTPEPVVVVVVACTFLEAAVAVVAGTACTVVVACTFLAGTPAAALAS